MSDPETTAPKACIPGFPRPLTWETMRAIMHLLAWTPETLAMVDHLMEGLRVESPFLTPELIRRELAIIFTALVDPSFPSQGGLTMT